MVLPSPVGESVAANLTLQRPCRFYQQQGRSALRNNTTMQYYSGEGLLMMVMLVV
jgi:hypothetical protein